MTAIAVPAPQEPVDPVRAFIDRTAGRLFAAAGFTPNQVTVLGTLVALSGCAVWTQQTHSPKLYWVGWGLTLGGTGLDALDGSVARVRNMHTRFGGLLDSLTDRVVETAIWAALFWLCSADWGRLGCLLALAGSFMVSYTRAKAELDGLRGTAGWGSRQVRLPLLAVCVLAAHWTGYNWVGWPVAVLAWLTVIQRAGSINRQLSPSDDPTSWGHGGQL
ncbi:MAG TPA: CDP-alcohol phosphatidyltransferase family protein [Candidatus Saccharimonadales bacterium]|nr:CDP-alcohol phosphatidyltransferase family protein [Candidatus Saccharimonadales bacterium]